jgi:hypothetical protein
MLHIARLLLPKEVWQFGAFIDISCITRVCSGDGEPERSFSGASCKMGNSAPGRQKERSLASSGWLELPGAEDQLIQLYNFAAVRLSQSFPERACRAPIALALHSEQRRNPVPFVHKHKNYDW